MSVNPSVGPLVEHSDAVKPKIAVVEDDRDVRIHLEQTLTSAGFDVMAVRNGLRLMSALMVDRPDVIVLDVVTSWIDGFELCRALKRNPDFRDIPVILLSGRSSPGGLERGRQVGAADYLSKPVDSRMLIARVAELVSDNRIVGDPPSGI